MTMTQNGRQNYSGTELGAMSFARNYHQWILDEFRPWLGECVAEVGAGAGSFSLLLLATPVKRLVAFEPTANMYPQLENALRHEPRVQCVNDVFSAGYAPQGFDTVAYVNVLEHIADDQAELARAFAALRPGGHILLFAPALAWLYSAFDKEAGHVRRYTRHGLKELVTKTGFTVVKARYFDIAGVLPWYVNFVLLKRPMGSVGVAWYDRLVVPPMRLFEHAFPPPLGKNVLLVAQKPPT